VTAVFSKKILAEAEALFAKYPDRRAALLPLFWAIQRSEDTSRGNISRPPPRPWVFPGPSLGDGRVLHPVPQGAARSLSPAGVPYLVVRPERGGGPPAYLQEHLGLRDGETTPDGLFSYQEVECLACCHAGPCLSVNESGIST
jgi:NADH-quinone oxidoreductase subunit E